MSVIQYGDITIPYTYTTSFNQEVVYDEISSTDWYCTKFDIQVQGIINLAYIDVIAPKYTAISAPDNAAAIMNAIRVDLLKPRKKLSFKVNDIELIPQATTDAGSSLTNPGTVDVRNGPKPMSCSYSLITGVTFIIHYHITAYYWENNDVDTDSLEVTNRTGNPVLYNKWSEMVEIDGCLMSKRIREGKYVIRSDNDKGLRADELRSAMAVVGVPRGFVRESSRYKISPDGLGIEYTVTDKEVFKMPPKLAYEADGWYKESTTRCAAKRYGEVYVRLKGAKDVRLSPQTTLVEIAMAICVRKTYINSKPGFSDVTVPGSTVGGSFFGGLLGGIVGFLIPLPGTTALGTAAGAAIGGYFGSKDSIVTKWQRNVLEFAHVKVDMYKNEVEVHMKHLLQSKPLRKMGMTGLYGPMCHTPFSEDGSDPPAYFDRGSASLFLQAAAYFDPSITPNNLGQGGQFIGFLNPIQTANSPQKGQMEQGLQVGTAGLNLET